jgi:hypothetical protein
MVVFDWFIMVFCSGLTWYLVRREEKHYKVINELTRAIDRLTGVVSKCPKKK